MSRATKQGAQRGRVSARTLALAFTALMLSSTLPVTNAHHVDPNVPDVPTLPRVYPTQNCVPVGLDAEILWRVNAAMQGDPAFYQTALGVPSLCVNGPVKEFQDAVNLANEVLGQVRNASNEIQRQVNWRLENALPESRYPNELVEPRTVLLNDSFDGFRTGGFGEWKVVTHRGEEPLWSIERVHDVNGTSYAYRFGRDDGYEQGTRQFLVSPEIDLTAVKGNRTAVRDLTAMRQMARDFLTSLCIDGSVGGVVSGGPLGSLSGACTAAGDNGAPMAALIEAYEAAIDEHIYSLPVMQHGAQMELTYKLNMAPGEDGVRLWVYSADRAPDRANLFNESLASDAKSTCAYDAPVNYPTPAGIDLGQLLQLPGAGPAQTIGAVNKPGTGTYELTCAPQTQRGWAVENESIHTVPVGNGTTGYGPVTALAATPAQRRDGDASGEGFTGDIPGWVTVRVNLTDWIESRVWIVLEVATKSNARGEDTFNDPSRFTRRTDYGFQLGRLYVEGSAYHRNFRVKDVAATYAYQGVPNPFDDPNTTRATTPPGNAPVVAWVHNAGDYNENGTITISARARSNQTSSNFETLGSTSVNVSLRPDDVKAVSVPWSRLLTDAHPTLRENWLYEVTASLAETPWEEADVDDLIENTGNGTPQALDPNVTRVQPANVAGNAALGAGTLSVASLVRAATIRDVTLVRPDGLSGNPILLCRAAPGDECEPHFAGPKGEPRKVVVGVRNDGNTAQNITLELTATLDGIGKPDVVGEGARKVARDVLPGEVRPVTWIVTATQPGAYDLTVVPMPELPVGVAAPTVENAERKLFVQRSTGLICLDSILESECGIKLTGALVPKLRGENVTAAALGPDGRLYVATAITEPQGAVHSGLLAARDADGEWVVLANLSASVLNATLGAPPREGLAYANVRAIVPAPDGSIYLLGLNDTSLRFSPETGEISRVPSKTTLPTDYRAALWYKGTLLAAGSNGVMARLVNGAIEPFNVTSTSYEPNANNQTVAVQRRYAGNFTSLVVAPNGNAVAAGERLVLQHAGNAVTSGWTEARAANGKIMGDALLNATVLTMAVHDGRIVLGTSEAYWLRSVALEPLWMSASDATTGFQPLVAPPAVPEDIRRTIAGIASHEGNLLVLQGGLVDSGKPPRYEVAVCSASCVPGTGIPRWDFVTPNRPTASSQNTPPHPALPAILLGTGASVSILGEAGMVLDLLDVGVYENRLDWSVAPLLAARHGGVLQTSRGVAGGNALTSGGRTSLDQGIYLVPDDANLSLAQGADRFRVFLNHSLNWTDAGASVEVRLVFRNYPNLVYKVGGVQPVYTCSYVTDGPSTQQQLPLGDLGVICESSLFRAPVAEFREPTSPSDGWMFVGREIDAATIGSPLGSSDPIGLGFWALEINTTNGTRWAMDDIRLEGRVGGQWREILSWHGPHVKNGDWFIQDIYNHAFQRVGTPPAAPLKHVIDLPDLNTPPKFCTTSIPQREAGSLNQTIYRCFNIPDTLGGTVHGAILNATKPTPTQPTIIDSTVPDSTSDILRDERLIVATPSLYQWEIFPGAPFDLATWSPWHISQDWADRPVFAANNEQYKTGWSDPRGPKLMNNWDARLVSPVIDLSDAYDPVVAWKHLYSFRTLFQPGNPDATSAATRADRLQVADGGFLEIQYTMKGTECGPDVKDPEFVCWSRFFPVKPDGGYPTRVALGFGSVDQAFYSEQGPGSPSNLINSNVAPPVHRRIGDPSSAIGDELSYWGSLASPDDSGKITATGGTDNYVDARITLANVRCKDDEIQQMREHHARRYDCIKDNLTGRQIRVAFHIMTAGNWAHLYDTPEATVGIHATGRFKEENVLNESNLQACIDGCSAKRTYGGEGWYITDFRVLGARELGIDLSVPQSNMTFGVGYDVKKIGVGPGTRVPINVTVENRGVFDALGYTGRLEVRRLDSKLVGGSEIVDVVTLAQQPLLEQKAYRNHTLFWNVPAVENERYTLTFTATPIGIDRDEDHLDNVARLGTPVAPILAKTTRQFKVEVEVSPQNATAEIPRFLPMFVNNTGNVPLAGLSIERRISGASTETDADAASCTEWRERVAKGVPTTIVDCRTWALQRAAPEGKRTPITALSDDVDATRDLFFKAPEQKTYYVDLAGFPPAGLDVLPATARTQITAFATYLFDDVEGGLRGDATTGEWAFGAGWNSSQPGFRSSDAYAFGDPVLGRFPADTTGALRSPTVDLGSARTASLAFYTKYAFETGFDGAVIEASDDGGLTWHAVEPIAGNPLLAGYNRSAGHEVQASSALHPDGNPETKAYAFTSDSSLLPSNLEGWVLTQTDLTGWANITEADVEYDAYHAAEMSRYSLPPRVDPTNGTDQFFAADWCESSAHDSCWSAQNLTHSLRSPLSELDRSNTFWWSGSASRYDDGVRPVLNQLLEFPVDLSAIAPGQTVIAEWWEYGTRFNARSIYLDTRDRNVAATLNASQVHNVFAYHAAGAGDNYRFNLGEPTIVEKRGHWYRLQADMSGVLDQLGPSKVVKVGFAYTPIRKYDTATFACAEYDVACTVTNFDYDRVANGSTGADPNTAYSAFAENDLGFAVDGFQITAYTVTRGVRSQPVLVIDESRAWGTSVVYECGTGNVTSTGTAKWHERANYVGCMHENERVVRRPMPSIPGATAVGRHWNVVSALPGVNASWHIVPVTDFLARSKSNKLPTGEAPVAWYTGDIACRGENNTLFEPYCPRPNSEGRLITPTFDLSRIAGDNARLNFWHRFAFHQHEVGKTPLASGGVVEISVLDPQTGEWSAWDQIYSSDDFRATPPCPAGDAACTPTTPRLAGRGGYTGFTANASETSEGPRRFDSPFKNVVPADRATPVQFLYTGNSSRIESALPVPEGLPTPDGWLQEEFDVSKYIGRKVRFGFHYNFNGATTTSQADEGRYTIHATHPDKEKRAYGGWWVSDVAIVGDVLVGKPVQLRVRAATDGNVHDGRFLVDDFGVFGARYRNNVGVFVDGSGDRYGGYPSSVTSVPVTIRNLGDTVRRNLALEVRVVGSGVSVSGAGPEGSVTLADGAYVLKGFTLGPGQSTTVGVNVHAPKESANASAKIVFALREANPGSTERPFGAIIDNEVQGILSRMIDFRLQRKGEFSPMGASILQIAPQVGQSVDYVLRGQNTGHGPITLTPACVARTVTGYQNLEHVGDPVEKPVVAASYPCKIAGDVTLGPKEWTNLTFTATPTTQGYLSFDVKLTLADPMGNVENVAVAPAGVPISLPLTTYRETFDRVQSVRDNFTGTPFDDSAFGGGVSWSPTRGHRSVGALLVGVNETAALEGTSYASFCGAIDGCKAITPPIDLHNYSASTPAFLSFYHLDRMARHDGAQVRAQVLVNERRPGDPDAWSKPCILEPLNGYEGPVRQIPPTLGDPANGVSGDPGDPNTAFQAYPYLTQQRTPGQPETSQGPGFFVTPGGVWEETWQLAIFPLPARCVSVENSAQSQPLLGRTVRFVFEVFAGSSPNGPLRRGAGHGFLVDEISVGPLALEVRPLAGQRAGMLDNTTKGFNVLLKNLGTMPDVVKLEYDALNSSAPAGSIRVPSGTITIQPGESRVATVQVTLPRDPSLLPTEFTARLLARSTLDPNAAGATRLDLAFGPRQWAELAVSVEAPKGIVQEATDTFIPVVIENSGLVDSVGSKLRIVDEWAGGRIEHELELPSMPSYAQSADEALRVLEFRWRPERGSAGEHTLTFIADPNVLGEEYTRTNNVVTLKVPVSDLLIPDLAIANFSALRIRNALGGAVTPGFDADVARYEVTAGEIVSFDLKVANKGRAGATNIEVRAFIGALSLPPKTIPYIAPGTEAVVTFNWLAQKGEHEIEFIVRNEQVELVPTNNRYPGTGVTILTVKGYEVAVEIEPVLHLLQPESEIRVNFSITNNGNAGEDLELRAKGPAGTRLLLPRTGFFLRAGETYSDTARFILDAEAIAGQQFISIDAIARENPMKVATGRAGVGVAAFYGGSVAGGFAAGSPPELVVPVDLVNEGNSLEPWLVKLTLPLGWTTKEPQPARIVVPAHDRATFAFHVVVPQGTAPGDRVIGVSATMANGERREGVARVNVLPLRAASVVVKDDVAPAPVRGELAIPIRVQNTGNVREPFQLLLMVPPAGLEMRVEPADFLLAPGAIGEATLLVKPNATIESGTYAIGGFTRFEGVVPQTREGMANLQTLRVPIVRQDLRVTALEFSPRAELDAGDRVTVRVSVMNFGQFDVENVPVHLFVDDVFAAETVVARIAAGARADVTFNWTATNGVHTLTAVVDPYKDTVDAAREDNAVSALATVGVQAANGGVAAGRADAPMGGAWVAIAAIAAAMVMARKFGPWRRERR